jgi:hypothetical protein
MQINNLSLRLRISFLQNVNIMQKVNAKLPYSWIQLQEGELEGKAV